jgi:hypothetical protein
MNNEALKLPTEIIDLPSKGLIYPEGNPLSSGQIEMKYMTAREEDILTNQGYISKGIVLDELMKSLIVSKINYNDLITGDKNAIMIAARILGYGKDYKFTYLGEEHNVDLTTLENKELDEKAFTKGVNEFSFTLPHSKVNITYKLLTHGDELQIEAELNGLKKINKNVSPEISTRLKYMITSFNGNRENKDIRQFVDDFLLARDSRALRDHIRNTQPDIDLTFFPDNNEGTKVNIPINISFFYPES